MQHVPHFFTEEQLHELRGLPEVIKAYEKLDRQDKVYFTVPLTKSIQYALHHGFGLDVSEKTQIPFRWIKGDTPAHMDRGESSFDKTYLVYLTNGEGEFHLGEERYSIVAGAGYSFSEGLSHEVVGTNGTSRLLLGPMSEQGFPVGGINIYADGATDTVYIADIDGTVSYKINNGDWTAVPFACYVGNSNADPSNNILKVLFTTNITLTSWNQNFWCATDGIQFGNDSLNSDGTRTRVVVQDAPLFRGLILNGSPSQNAYNHIYIYNINVIAEGTSTLDDGTYLGPGGWIGGASYGKSATNNYIINCSSSGDITQSGGGIVGQGSGGESGASLTLIGCSSYGSIASNAGGIVGATGGSTAGSVTCDQCWSEGNITGQDGGGIFGSYAGNNSGYALAIKCYSIGAISSDGGGIFGGYAGESSGQAYAQKCYSRGSIGASAGGIFSRYAAYFSGTTIATNCYSSGSISGYGIYGVNQQSGATQSNCYAANNNWSDSSANGSLMGVPIGSDVGTTWVKRGTNEPYELNGIGATPYTLNNINTSSELVQTFSQTVQAGSASSSAAIRDTDPSGNDFTILAKTGGDDGSYSTITMNSQTGAISTTSATVPGTYTLTVRSIGSYFITTFVLTVSAFTPEELAGSSTCCVTTINERGLDYAQINNYRIGNRLLLEVSQNPKTKFDGYSQYVKYKIAQGSRKI